MKKLVEEFLEASGIGLCNGEGFQELRQFQEHLLDYKIIVFDGFNPDRVMFSGSSLSAKKLYLPYDGDHEHYDVITNLLRVLWLSGTYVTGVIFIRLYAQM